MTARVAWTGLTRACCEDHSPPVCVKSLPPDKSWAGDAAANSASLHKYLTAKRTRCFKTPKFGILFAPNYKREQGMEATFERRKFDVHRRQTGEPNMWREDMTAPSAKLTLSLVAATFVAITMFAVAATAQSNQESQPELTAPLEPLRPGVEIGRAHV